MRLSKFLSLCVAMSRNQANFFIRKGRLSVDGTVVTDPYFELAEDSEVIFDGNPISIAQYQYILLHKPVAYACATTDAAQPSVLHLLKNRTEERYYYFANTLAPEVTGLILLSDDARWANRMKRRLLTKQRIYQVTLNQNIDAQRLAQVQRSLLDSIGASSGTFDIQQSDERTLLLNIENVSTRKITAAFATENLAIERLHLAQVGRMGLGALGEGECLEFAENDIKI